MFSLKAGGEMENTNKKRKINNILITVVIITAVIINIITYSLFYNTINLFYSGWSFLAFVAGVLGISLPGIIISLIISLFLILILKKKHKFFYYFAFIFLCASLFVLYISYSGYQPVTMHKIEAKKAITEIEMQFEKMVKSSELPSGAPERIQEEIQTSPKSKGVFGEMERFVKIFMDRSVSLRNDYLLELSAIGWDKILDPIRLKNERTFVESKFTINKAKEIVEKYKTLTNILFEEDAFAEIDRLEISEDLKQEMKNGLKRGLETTKIMLSRYWYLEGETILESEKIFDLLSSRKDAWIIENQQVLFYNENDLKEFNTYISNVQDYVKEQQLIHQQSIDQTKESLKVMKENLK
jgi:hypothetical protein